MTVKTFVAKAASFCVSAERSVVFRSLRDNDMQQSLEKRGKVHFCH